jgi:hypothetical protein
VLLLDGPSPARSRQLADDIWQSLDAESESITIPFDSAGTRFNPHSAVKLKMSEARWNPGADSLGSNVQPFKTF